MNKKVSNSIICQQLKKTTVSSGGDFSISEIQLRKIRCLLLAQAHKKHGHIKPCGTWDKCFTKEGNTIFFWYQTSIDDSTHLVAQNVNKLYPSKLKRVGNTGMRIKHKRYSTVQ
jgi:hypothetical protein